MQKMRHMNDIQLMILNNPLFKNLEKKDQKKLAKLIYKAEMVEVFVRDKEIVRINESFNDIIAAVANMLDEDLDDDDENNPPYGKDF
jgi:hypothetical protein